MLNVMNIGYPLNIVLIVLGSLVLAGVGIFFGLLYRGIDRKIHAHMQGRVGPPVVQPFRDVKKLLMKENIVPEGALSWLFTAAPFICFASSVLVLFYIPLFGQQALLGSVGDVILVLYLLIIPALALVMGGFASSSPFATVGSQREMVIMVSYELPLAVVIITLAWRISHLTGVNPFMLSTIARHPIWSLVSPVGTVGSAILLLSLVVVTPGEASKVPFDIAEAETEIAGGVLVEYSGRNLCMFYLADAVKSFAVVSLIVALFFPYNLSSILGLETSLIAGAADILFFLFKVFMVWFFSIILVRTAMARFKITQASWIYIIATTCLALGGLILIWIDFLI